MKRLGVYITVFSILLFGGNVDIGYTDYMNDIKQDSAERTMDSLYILFEDAPVLEYGNVRWDPAELVEEHSGTLDVATHVVEQLETGEHELKYIVSETDDFGQEVSKEYTQTVVVQDTVAPEISLKKDVVSVIIGNGYDLKENVSAVSDPVDGSLRLASVLEPGTYVVEGSANTNSIGTYNINVKAMDVNGNTSEKNYKVSVGYGVYYGNWNGQRLTPTLGAINGPSGKETYYNLDMSGVVAIMRRMGNTDPYWVREDGCKMLGPYIMVAAHLGLRPRGSLVETSLGTGLVCDTGTFALRDPYQIDIAVNW